MSKLAWMMIGVLLAAPVLADQNDFRCLKSIGLKKPLRVQVEFAAEKDRAAYVTYENGSGRIPVKQVSEKETRRVPGGRPSEFAVQWQEITPEGAGGKYVFSIQGAIMDDFRYIRKDGKVFKFEDDPDAYGDERCNWAGK